MSVNHLMRFFSSGSSVEVKLEKLNEEYNAFSVRLCKHEHQANIPFGAQSEIL